MQRKNLSLKKNSLQGKNGFDYKIKQILESKSFTERN
jgi:hypothetical protein